MNLEIKKIIKKYKDKTAVKDFSIDFTEGIWGLLGPNGAGKTTLMRMLVGITEPTGGSISFNQKNIYDMGMKYRELIGYLPQKIGYDKNLTVMEFLLYIAYLKGLNENDSKSKIRELLERFSLSMYVNKKIRNLSGGMQQRVGILQAILNDPDILILDEPTAGLDIEERRRFKEFITEFGRGRIVIISTHIVSDIEFISNNLVIMGNGELLKNGNTTNLIRGLEGMVWEATIGNNQMKRYKDEIHLINYNNIDSNNTKVRYIGKNKIIPGAVSLKPELNDLYLYVTK